MNVFVIAQMILPTECLAANVAWKWPFVGVRALVDLQIVAFREVALAILTDELLLRSCTIRSGHFDRAEGGACLRMMHTPMQTGMLELMLLMLVEGRVAYPLIHNDSRMGWRHRLIRYNGIWQWISWM